MYASKLESCSMLVPLGTTNSGANWTAANSGLTNTDVRALVFSGSNLLAGTGGGGVFRSTNSGSSWTATNSGLGNLSISSLFSTGGLLYAGTMNGPYRSTNNGTDWTAVNTGLITRIEAFAQSGSNLFAGAGLGLWLSTNNGASWTKVSTDAACKAFYSLYILGTTLYAGTDMGVWKRPISELTGVDVPSVSHMPEKPVLYQNYPNPFNPGTTVCFSTGAPGFVSLRIYDLRGREVAVVISRRLEQGRHEATWNASGFPAGIYTCSLETEGSVQTRKLVLIK